MDLTEEMTEHLIHKNNLKNLTRVNTEIIAFFIRKKFKKR